MAEFDIVIGLETHIELNTKTKVFCGCKNEFGGEPNSHCCPVCIGLPGVLPMLNQEAVKKAVMIGLATESTIAREFYFDRKHYFYPDLAKAYQISQGNTPICTNGYIEITGDNGAAKKIRIHQIHLEEDAGKLIHSASGETFVDYNRGGVLFVEKNFRGDCSVDALAHQIGYSENYLSRYFMNAIGMSFHSYVIQYRLEQACHMMRNTNEPILRCAMDNGFTSLRSFNRNFSLYIGMTPTEYREKQTLFSRS